MCFCLSTLERTPERALIFGSLAVGRLIMSQGESTLIVLVYLFANSTRSRCLPMGQTADGQKLVFSTFAGNSQVVA